VHFKTIAKLGRFKEIVVTLLKYGFDDLVERLDFPGFDILKKIHKDSRGITTNERIRCILEDLGGTFIKIGQIMSLRPDLLPKDLLRELSKLQDQVAPLDFEQVRGTLEKGIGCKIEDCFSVFDPEPFAAASLAQVHRAVLKEEGHIVSVKIQRPGIKRKIETDLDILEAIAHRLNERSDELKIYNLPNLVRVTRRNLLQEIDFQREVHNIKIAKSFESDVYIPDLYENYCSQKILVTEFIHGEKLTEAEDEIIGDRQALAKLGLNTAIKQILEDGFFHADPHPGNLILSREKGLCLIDWGMVGRLTERDQYELIDIIRAIVKKESNSLTEALLRITVNEREIDERALERDLDEILDLYFSGPIKNLNVGSLLLSIIDILRGYRLVLPSNLVIMIKALVTAEGAARHLYPELDIISEAENYVTKIASKRYRVEMLWQALRKSLMRLLSMQHEIPRRFNKIADKIERDELGIRFRHENLESLNHTLENVSNRLSFSIIIAALIIGSSMIITTGIGPYILGFPALGIIGYIISSILGLWLIITIIRTRKY
jgi:ubiquinone biosynthesis protein